MKRYTITVTEPELAFARDLVSSKIAVTMENVETIAAFKKAVLTAQEVPETAVLKADDTPQSA